MEYLLIFVLIALIGAASAIPEVNGQQAIQDLQLALSGAAMVTIFGWYIGKTSRQWASKGQTLLEEINRDFVVSYTATPTATSTAPSLTTTILSTVGLQVLESRPANVPLTTPFAVCHDNDLTTVNVEEIVGERMGAMQGMQGSLPNTAAATNNTNAMASLGLFVAAGAQTLSTFTLTLRQTALDLFVGKGKALIEVARQRYTVVTMMAVLSSLRTVLGWLINTISLLMPTSSITLAVLSLVVRGAALMYKKGSPYVRQYSVVVVRLVQALHEAYLVSGVEQAQPVPGAWPVEEDEFSGEVVESAQSPAVGVSANEAQTTAKTAGVSADEARTAASGSEGYPPSSSSSGPLSVLVSEQRVPGAWPVEEDELTGEVVESAQPPAVGVSADEAQTTAETAGGSADEARTAASESESFPPSSSAPGHRPETRHDPRRFIPTSPPSFRSGQFQTRPSQRSPSRAIFPAPPAGILVPTGSSRPVARRVRFLLPADEPSEPVQPTTDVESQQAEPAPPPAPTEQQPTADNGSAMEQPCVMSEEVAGGNDAST